MIFRSTLINSLVVLILGALSFGCSSPETSELSETRPDIQVGKLYKITPKADGKGNKTLVTQTGMYKAELKYPNTDALFFLVEKLENNDALGTIIEVVGMAATKYIHAQAVRKIDLGFALDEDLTNAILPNDRDEELSRRHEGKIFSFTGPVSGDDGIAHHYVGGDQPDYVGILIHNIYPGRYNPYAIGTVLEKTAKGIKLHNWYRVPIKNLKKDITASQDRLELTSVPSLAGKEVRLSKDKVNRDGFVEVHYGSDGGQGYDNVDGLYFVVDRMWIHPSAHFDAIGTLVDKRGGEAQYTYYSQISLMNLDIQ